MNTVLATVLYMLTIILYIAASIAIPCFLIFLILKLCGIIVWNWVFVFMPMIVMMCCITLLGILDVILKDN